MSRADGKYSEAMAKFIYEESIPEGDQASFREALGSPKQAIIAFRNAILSRTPVSFDLMQDAPTITVSAPNAASSIVDPVSIPSTSSVLIAESVRCVTGPSFPYDSARKPQYIDTGAPGDPAAYSTGLVSSWTIITDAPEIEFRIFGQGAPSKGSLWVTENGQRKFAGVLEELPPDGNLYRVKAEFSGRSMREIEIELSGVYFQDFTVSDSDVCGQKILTGPKVAILGDSFTEGAGAGSYHLGYAAILLRILGIEKKIISGVGGAGYFSTAGGTKKNLLQRLQTDVIDLEPDIIIHANGINDDDAGLEENAPLVFDAITSGLPNSAQIVFGPFQPRSINVETRRAALESFCEERGIIFIDNVILDEITGTGRLGNPQSDGNSDIVISSDSTHPSPYGHRYIADWRAAEIIKAVGSIF